MKSKATNNVGLAVEALLAAVIDRLMENGCSPEEKAKVHLALREEFATPEMQGLVLGSCEVLHDAAEDVACNLLNQVLYPDD